MIKKLDPYHLQIVAQHFFFADDFINMILVCKKYSCILDRFRYNPIPITSTKLFPNIETQYLYNEKDVKLPEIKHVVVLYKVDNWYANSHLKEPNITFKNLHVTVKDTDKITKEDELIQLMENTNIRNYGSRVFNSFYFDTFKVPIHITNLEKCAFSDYDELESVTLSEGLKIIPTNCFSGCLSLTSIHIPSSITKIMENAFEKCGFETFDMPSSIYSIENDAFRYCEKSRDIHISPNVKIISSATFIFCKNLTNVKLPDNLQHIQACAFKNCRQLEVIKIPASVCLVDREAFSDCIKMKELVFSNNCAIKEQAFVNCTSLTKLVVPNIEGKVIHKIYKEEIPIFIKFYDKFDCDTYNDEYGKVIYNNLSQEVCLLLLNLTI
ncbi:hypothetical protein EIN_116260 [Entamoeba invadens IP1]|uniref:Leucine rich repeat containing protein BspA family protein n=1 Tax=Entamoeba invadens IP1 TaxID=370355 RepID=L7FPC7_ENTIV|nr:hypothetical protein EIN_116260 [Entamoeba invadens IP1]ELP94525.1 hypothetical protein EIN_116260 [Entamoeba invadens IP1]|eukprot:XP_004261296.1 hypothetical protein EIN_116260 [Entamoeba invadens IP1]